MRLRFDNNGPRKPREDRLPRLQQLRTNSKTRREGAAMSLDPKSVMEKIDVDELVKVTLDLANIDSPTGEEGAAAEYVYDWLMRQGFEARKIALYPDRPNIVATLPGTSYGRSLCFNSHLDTTIHKDEWWTSRRAADPIFHTGWREGDTLIGNGVCNCKA